MSGITRHPRRRIENGRLAYYDAAADGAFWDQHWRQNFSRDTYNGAEQGRLGWFEKPFTRYLPKAGPILEAGCGLGQLVVALRVRGYEAEGVEWAPEIVKKVQGIYPNLPVRVGDVTDLDVPDGYYKGYISLGVMEHRQAGPESFLQEAYRVLSPDGVALISIPCLHSLRLLKARLGFYRDCPDGLEFYQYAFMPAEFSRFLQQAGFQVVDQTGYDSPKGLKDELPWLRPVFQWRWIGSRLQNRLRASIWAEQTLGHMMLFACKKR